MVDNSMARPLSRPGAASHSLPQSGSGGPYLCNEGFLLSRLPHLPLPVAFLGPAMDSGIWILSKKRWEMGSPNTSCCRSHVVSAQLKAMGLYPTLALATSGLFSEHRC